MTRFLEWTRANPGISWAGVGTYYVIVVLSHDLVQRPALALQRAYGIEFIHYVIAAILAVFLGFLVSRIWVRIREHHQRRWVAWSGALLLGWSLLVFSALMVRSIETIHFIQYLVLVLVMSSLLRNPLLVVLIGTLCGLVDEAWQFAYLHPGAPYFDFNDVVMNTTGALQGAWFYALFRSAEESGTGGRRRLLGAWTGFLVVVIALFLVGTLTVYKQDSGLALHRRVPPTPPKPVHYVTTNRWGNTWIRVHPYAGVGFLFFLPLVVLALPPPKEEAEPAA